MGVAEFTVFLTGEGTRRNESSGVRGALALLAWQTFCGLFSASGKVHCCYSLIYHNFPPNSHSCSGDAKLAVSQKDFDSGVCQR